MTSRFKVDQHERPRFERRAKEIRLHALLEGWARDSVVDEIVRQLPLVSLLEAHRYAHGWTRREVSLAIDCYYGNAGLMAPQVTPSEICGWEHGRHLPGQERQRCLCWIYRTRPDRLGFGCDYSAIGARDHVNAQLLILNSSDDADQQAQCLSVPLASAGTIGVRVGEHDRILSVRWCSVPGVDPELEVEVSSGSCDGRSVIRLGGVSAAVVPNEG
jgi:hypothetical protein